MVQTKTRQKTRQNRKNKPSHAKQFDLTELQTRLGKMPLYQDRLDGMFGTETAEAIKACLVKQNIEDWQDWSNQRLLVAGQQAICAFDNIEVGTIDGLAGPQTKYAIEVYEARLNGNPEPEFWRDKTNTTPATDFSAATQNWPRQRDCARYFGKPGENQTRLYFPHPMRLAWDTKTIVRSTLCHEKIHDPALRVLQRALDHYGDQIPALGLDLFGGCLNVRKMRGGSSWSTHAWGIAFDFDPARNQLRWGRNKAAFAKPAYEKWFDLWEEEGAISLGRTKNFDWMHVQFARL